jgi:integrase
MDAYPSMWSVSRRVKLVPNTREVGLHAIISLRLWAKMAGVDVEAQMVYGECLSSDEVADLKYHLSLGQQSLRMLAHGPPADVNKFLSEAKRVSSNSFNLRITYVHDYLKFLGEYGNKVLRNIGQNQSLFMRHRRERLRPAVRVPGSKRNRYEPGSISEELLSAYKPKKASRLSQSSSDVLERVALFISTANMSDIWPKNNDLRLRNEVLLLMLLQTGGRVSELLQAKIDDLIDRKRTIEFRRRHNDPDDPRKREPNLKTFDRELRLSEETWEKLERWLEVHDEVTAATHSPFIFVSFARNPKYFGQPICRQTVKHILDEVCDAAGLPRIRIHDLRHIRVRRLAELAREQNWTNEEWRKAATYLFGWSAASHMPGLYLGDTSDLAAEMAMSQIWRERGFGE